MTSHTCPRCDKPVRDQATICHRCATRLERDLGDVPAVAADLEAVLARQTRTGDTLGRPSAETPVPYHGRASEVLGTLRAVLVGWVRDLHRDRDREGPACRACRHASCRALRATEWPADTLPAMAGWLLDRGPALRRHPAADDLAAEVHDAMAAALVVADRPPERLYAGPCDGDGCPGSVYGDLGSPTVACDACGAEYDTEARRRWLLAAAEDQLAPASQLARALTALDRPVTVERIWQWASRGRLAAHGVDLRGRPTYRVGDVRTLLDADAARQAGRRTRRERRSAAC